MQPRTRTPQSPASMRLSPAATAQLDELARHHDRTFDQAAAMAIHIAYLALLDEKREDALQALDMRFGRPYPDDELPF
ncbi:MAG: putative transcriptional regulator [Reinekea sp.]